MVEDVLPFLPISGIQEKIQFLLSATYSVYIASLIGALSKKRLILKIATEKLKDKLQAFRDISDHAVRKELTKASDSNSEAQRIAGRPQNQK